MLTRIIALFCIHAFIWLHTVGSVQAKVLHSEASMYQNIIVDQYKNKRCLKFSKKNRTSNQSCIFTDKPNFHVFVYTKLMMSSLLLQPDPESVLIIGLGAGTLPNAFAELSPNTLVETVEIDPQVLTMAKDYFDFEVTDRNQVFVMDARVFIKRAIRQKKRYDIIILDAFSGDYIPEHLMTKEFFEEVKAITNQNGIIAANTFTTSKLVDYETATYLSVFQRFTQIKSSLSANRVILVDTMTPDKRKALTESGLKKYGQQLNERGVPAAQILKLFTVIDSPADKSRILTDQYSPVNILNSR